MHGGAVVREADGRVEDHVELVEQCLNLALYLRRAGHEGSHGDGGDHQRDNDPEQVGQLWMTGHEGPQPPDEEAAANQQQRDRKHHE
jgi:hypothetical protein